MRLDQYLADGGHFPSRARAKAAIEAGLVSVNGELVKKVSMRISPADDVTIEGDVHPFVSRGGVKLDAMLRHMEIDASDKTCLDLGASTGGFTDVLLRAGAAKVFAVDVGTGQLHSKIASDPRVINLEKTHARDLTSALIPDPIDLIVCDVSFISLKKALPPALALAAPGAQLAALIKPQFEVGRSQIGKGGIVKPGEPNQRGVVDDITRWLGAQDGWRVIATMDSPIEGGDGNREFLMGGIKSDA